MRRWQLILFAVLLVVIMYAALITHVVAQDDVTGRFPPPGWPKSPRPGMHMRARR